MPNKKQNWQNKRQIRKLLAWKYLAFTPEQFYNLAVIIQRRKEILLMKISDLKIINVLHYYATGAGQEFHNWFVREKIKNTTLLEHPFPFSNRNFANFESYSSGEKTFQKNLRRRIKFMPVRYILDFFRTIRLLLFSKEKYDLYIGSGCFDTLPGIVLKWFEKVDKVVIYTIDYVPETHGGGLYKFLYLTIDKFCCYHVDKIWNISRGRQMPARLKNGVKKEKCAPDIWVPHGTHALDLKSRLPEKTNPFKIAFFGHVKESSGVQLFIDTMPELLEKYSNLTLDVIGGGPYIETLKKQAEELSINDKITFHGFVENHNEAEAKLMQCGIAIALYSKMEGDFSEFGDPGKPKVYLACGLPVIIGNVPEIAEVIEENKAGKSISYNKAELKSALDEIIEDHKAYRANAIKLSQDFDWSIIISNALEATL